MVIARLLAYLAFSVFCVLPANCLDTFTAAVYEHAVILPNFTTTPVSREEALVLMNQNLDILEEAITSAAKQGAQIIVTPEDGVYGVNFSRDTIYPYLEDIPDPEVNWIPCNHPKRFGDTQIQERLSCLAKSNSIYVVANIGDKKPCNASDPRCPPDGRYQYNTNVVFDSQGKLVARYHKQHLFMSESFHFNAPKDPEVVTFNTPFGKFGIFTCFDILFYDPAITLVKDFHVDTILFPTAWMDVLPHLSAIEFHSAWAMGMGVNLLASNLHRPQNRMTGSGIYAPDSPRAFHYDRKTEKGKLVLSQLDSHPYRPEVNWSSYASNIGALSTGNQEFKGSAFYDEYTFVELTGITGNYTVCQKDLCCHLNYQMSEKRSNEIYALGAFDGLHTVEGCYHLQVCTMLKCKTTNRHTCGASVDTASTRFEMFSLSGTFGTQYVFPEVLLSEVRLAPGEFKVTTFASFPQLIACERKYWFISKATEIIHISIGKRERLSLRIRKGTASSLCHKVLPPACSALLWTYQHTQGSLAIGMKNLSDTEKAALFI
ncbi:PREDICTED: pantetheinase [Dipodomys ordii]|uniref:Pantetheinase n=1 Tax=Dipodomys ordii TaxID=10020 RepID=A0A1S3G0A6_DIPOR|nr:PREDICTED: pantetheinase [Dipodomys ordii]